MLESVFSFRGVDFKGNKAPHSYEHLVQAAHTVRAQHLKVTNKTKEEQSLGDFKITFTTASNPIERPIVDDQSLIHAKLEAIQ